VSLRWNCYILIDVYRTRAAKKRPTAPITGKLAETKAPALGDWVGAAVVEVWEAPPVVLAAFEPEEAEATLEAGLEEKPAAVGMT